jgi:hypothetical protein
MNYIAQCLSVRHACSSIKVSKMFCPDRSIYSVLEYQQILLGHAIVRSGEVPEVFFVVLSRTLYISVNRSPFPSGFSQHRSPWIGLPTPLFCFICLSLGSGGQVSSNSHLLDRKNDVQTPGRKINFFWISPLIEQTKMEKSMEVDFLFLVRRPRSVSYKFWGKVKKNVR